MHDEATEVQNEKIHMGHSQSLYTAGQIMTRMIVEEPF